MKFLKPKKLNQKGFDHVFLGIFIVVMVAIFGTYFLVKSRAAAPAAAIIGIDGKCLDNQYNKKATGNPIQLYTCNGTDAQKWSVQSNGQIENADGYCLYVAQNSTAAKSKVVLYWCGSAQAEKWSVNTSNHTIVNTASKLCLDDQYAKTADKNPIWIYACNGTAAQVWTPQSTGSTTTNPAPTVSVVASPTAISSGSTATLTWSSKNATSCTGAGGWSGTKATSGTYTTAKLTASTTYTLACTGNGGSGSGSATVSVNSTTSTSPTPTGTLLFDDEFTGAAGSAPSSAKWQIMNNSVEWGIQCFVNDRSHIYLDGSGHLVETATYSSAGSPCGSSDKYEAGGMSTGAASGGLFDFKYGTIEASIKVPCQSGTGLWPAFWSDGNNWPAGGEIDYLEIMDTHGSTDAEQSLHGPKSGGSWDIGNINTASGGWCGAYHTYGAIWSPGKVQFTIDGVVTHTDTASNVPSGGTWPFDGSNERLLLDLQVGNYGGTPTPSTFPQSMDVDYVRVYEN